MIEEKKTIQDFIIKLPIEIHEKVKAICAFRHISMKQFFLEAARTKIKDHESRQ